MQIWGRVCNGGMGGAGLSVAGQEGRAARVLEGAAEMGRVPDRNTDTVGERGGGSEAEMLACSVDGTVTVRQWRRR